MKKPPKSLSKGLPAVIIACFDAKCDDTGEFEKVFNILTWKLIDLSI
jgi:hypothetical protein